jgi:hypothetical protein
MSVESAMRRIVSVDNSITETDDREQQHDMYRKTLRALEDVEADDNDEGITVVRDWIIEQIESTGERPSSKAVRERAREYCRNNGYELPDDSWLGT